MAYSIFCISGAYSIPRLKDSVLYDNYNYKMYIGELEVYAAPKYYRWNNAIIRAAWVFRLKGLNEDLLKNLGIEWYNAAVQKYNTLEWDGYVGIEVDASGMPIAYYETEINTDTYDSLEIYMIPGFDADDVSVMLRNAVLYWTDLASYFDTTNINDIYGSSENCKNDFEIYLPFVEPGEIKKFLNAICNYTATGMKTEVDKIKFYRKLANWESNPKCITSDIFERAEVTRLNHKGDEDRITRISAYRRLSNCLECYISNEDDKKYIRCDVVIDQIYESAYMYRQIYEKKIYLPFVSWGSIADIYRLHGVYRDNVYEEMQALKWLLRAYCEPRIRMLIKTQYELDIALGEYVIVYSDYVKGADGNACKKYMQCTNVRYKTDYVEYELTESYEVGMKVAPDDDTDIDTNTSLQYGIIAPDGGIYYNNVLCAKICPDWYF